MGYMEITFSVDDKVISKARRRAEVLGTSVNQLVREYLEQLAGRSDRKKDAEEFVRLSRLSSGNPKGWKYNRDEAHERR